MRTPRSVKRSLTIFIAPLLFITACSTSEAGNPAPPAATSTAPSPANEYRIPANRKAPPRGTALAPPMTVLRALPVTVAAGRHLARLKHLILIRRAHDAGTIWPLPLRTGRQTC